MADSNPIGFIDSLQGDVNIVRGDASVSAPRPGDPIYQGDIVQTGADGVITIIFEDGMSFAIADDAEFVIDEFVYSPDTGDGSALFSMLNAIVDRIIDGASGTFGVRLLLPNEDHSLPGGLRCRVSFPPRP